MRAEAIQARFMTMLVAAAVAGWLLRDAVRRTAGSDRLPGGSVLHLEPIVLEILLAILLVAGIVWLGRRVRRALGGQPRVERSR